MKTFQLFILMLLFAMLAPAGVRASQSVAPKDARETIVKKALTQDAPMHMSNRMEKKMAKHMSKMEKFISKFAGGDQVDFNDPVDKWMWFWIFGWGLGLLLSIMGVFIPFVWYLGYLAWAAGTICLIIWILKKTGNM